MSEARSTAPLVAVPPGASEEEVAAMVAVITVLERERAAALAAARSEPRDQLDAWVRASRVSARRSGFARGPWRLSGRLTRRSRA